MSSAHLLLSIHDRRRTSEMKQRLNSERPGECVSSWPALPVMSDGKEASQKLV